MFRLSRAAAASYPIHAANLAYSAGQIGENDTDPAGQSSQTNRVDDSTPRFSTRSAGYVAVSPVTACRIQP